MENPVKIIIFQDDIEYTTSVHSDSHLQIMQFHRGHYEIFPDELIKIHDTDWQFCGVQPSDPITNFDDIWNIGMDFKNNPDRIKKLKRLEQIETQIELHQKKIDKLNEEHKKLNSV